jgi:hypothetical protein
MKRDNKRARYAIYKGDKLIESCTRKQINEMIKMGIDFDWLCKESKKLKYREG